jgi:hypothetical protein
MIRKETMTMKMTMVARIVKAKVRMMMDMGKREAIARGKQAKGSWQIERPIQRLYIEE